MIFYVILACFSRGDLLPRQAKIRQTGGKKATHEKCCTFVWRGERSPCEITKKSPFSGFLRGAFLLRKHDNTTWHKSATIVMNMWHGEQHMVWKWLKEHAQLEVGYSITVLHCNILQFNLKLCIVSVTVGWFLCGILNQLEYKSFPQEWVII